MSLADEPGSNDGNAFNAPDVSTISSDVLPPVEVVPAAAVPIPPTVAPRVGKRSRTPTTKVPTTAQSSMHDGPKLMHIQPHPASNSNAQLPVQELPMLDIHPPPLVSDASTLVPPKGQKPKKTRYPAMARLEEYTAAHELQQSQMPWEYQPTDLTAGAGGGLDPMFDAGLAGATSADGLPAPAAAPSEQQDPIDEEHLSKLIDMVLDGLVVSSVEAFVKYYLIHDCQNANADPNGLAEIIKGVGSQQEKEVELVRYIMNSCEHCDNKVQEEVKLGELMPILFNKKRVERIDGFLEYYSKNHCHKQENIRRNVQVKQSVKALAKAKTKKDRRDLKLRAKSDIIELVRSEC